MEESEDNMSADDTKVRDTLSSAKNKPKKRSLVERELETSLTARVTSPVTNGDGSSTSRYGRTRRLKIDSDFSDSEKTVSKVLKSPVAEVTPVKIQSPVYKMHASNSPVTDLKTTPKKISIDTNLDNRIENIYSENISLSRFATEEKKNVSPCGKFPKVYVRKDLIQTKEKEDAVIKSLSSSKSAKKSTNSHLNNILERSSEKYNLNTSSTKVKASNGYLDTSSVVKTLDFDNTKKKKKDNRESKIILSKSDLFELEAKCEYQVGDLAWARMGTYPFWPCIVTREPASGMFVKKKLFGRIERDIVHVTFFGDNGRRSWIVDTMLRKFLGQLEFEAARENFSPTAKKKDSRLYAAFFISEKKVPQWTISVEEAEMLLREPKRLRIDILNDMLAKSRAVKATRPQKSGKITRTASDVSLSESLYDTLFSEDDGKTEDPVRKSLDVSEVVTACLDNMAARTGMTKIQRQSHMDRWLQKAKSKTPEKSQAKIQVNLKEKEKISAKKQRKVSNVPVEKPYRLRKSYESQNLKAHQNEHDYSVSQSEDIVDTTRDRVLSGTGIGVIAKVESLSGKAGENDVISRTNDDVAGDSMDSLENDVFTCESPTFTQPFDETAICQIESVESESVSQNENSLSEFTISDSMCSQDLIENTEESENIATTDRSSQNGRIDNVRDSSEEKVPKATNNKLDFNSEPSSADLFEQMDVVVDAHIENNAYANDALVSDDNYANHNGHSGSDSVDTNTENDYSKNDKVLRSNKKINKVKPTPVKKKRNLRLKKSQSTPKNKKALEEAAFAKYLELHQDTLMDQHPELSQDEIVEYLRKTWQYEDPNSDCTINDISNSSIGISDSEKSSNGTILTDDLPDISNENSDSISKEKGELNNSNVTVENYNKVTNGVFCDAVSKKANRDIFNCVSDIEKNKREESNLVSGLNDKSLDESCSKLISVELNSKQNHNDDNHMNDIVKYDKTKEPGVENRSENKNTFVENINICILENSVHSVEENIGSDQVEDINKGQNQQSTDICDKTESVDLNINTEKDISKTQSKIKKSNNVQNETSLDIPQSPDALTNIVQPESEEIKTDKASNNKFLGDTKMNKAVENVSKEFNDICENTYLKDNEADTTQNNIIKKVEPCVQIVELGDELIQIHCSNKIKDKVSKTCDPPIQKLDSVLTDVTEKVLPKDATVLCNGVDDEMEVDESNSESATIPDLQEEKMESPKEPNVTENECLGETVNKFSESDVPNVDRNLSEPKINGLNPIEEGNDFSDCDMNAETSSINSEDSEPLSVVRNKLRARNLKKTMNLDDPEFIKYMELRQDDLMDAHPELNQQEVAEYLYKTWQYEENAKSDLMKSDDIEQSGLIKGLNGNLRQKSIRNCYRGSKKKKNKNKHVDSTSISSDLSDYYERRKFRDRTMSPVVLLEDCRNSFSKDSSPERKSVDDLEDRSSVNSEASERTLRSRLRNRIANETIRSQSQSPSNSLIEAEKETKENLKETIGEKSEKCTKNTEEKEITPLSSENTNKNKYFSIFESAERKDKDDDNKKSAPEKKIKEEVDPETISINSEDSEVSVSKRKQRKQDKNTNKTMDDPDFIKYLELRQDALIDENPQLTQEEITCYLYKTWLYEESVKSDLKKAEELEEANYVKGLNQETPAPRKYKKKVKTEKDPEDDFIPKEKPKRKTSEHYYHEDISDIEDEIELFEIFRQKPKSESPKVTKENSTDEVRKSEIEVKKSEAEVIDLEEDVYDEVELYFSELTKPKPNLFKGLIREKVCEICEKTADLVKCKGCHCMFHVECVKKQAVVVEEPVPVRGRKKKKKLNRKPKSLEDSGSHSDEKSQDVSEEMNGSLDETLEPETYTFDADNFEAALEAKMKEILPSDDPNYNSFASPINLDWRGAQPGKCEIVDVKIPKVETLDYSDFKCNNCQKYDTPICFVCKDATSKTGVLYRQRCQTAHCWKYYHLECLDHWPQTQFNSGEPSKNHKNIDERFEEFMCPRHVCHTCVSDDPRGCKTRFSGDKLARCVRCPATYHTFTKCLPAGTQILTGSHIVCPRHYEHRPGKVPYHVNTGWCFICALGGSLICCEYCPTSFHAECLNIKPPEGGYMCEDCETGRLPLYGEMVWVKLGHYRWWPGIILHPSEIPENIMAVKHSQGEFVVRFFGQYDHYWVNRGRVFPFQEGDSGRVSGQKSKIDAAFTTAMEHAQRACEILKAAENNDEEDTDIASSLLPPHYVKLKVNKPCGSLCGRRVDIEESSLTQCECDPNEEDPCGPYSHCLNRMLLTECGPYCRAGDRCNNRAFEKRLYPKMAPYRTPHRGWGLKALEDIKAGQFVIEYVGELIDEEEFRRRMKRKHEIRDENFYFLTLDKERMIDAGPKGNLARFMNHCCEPNCETQKWTVLGDVRVGLFALYDIPANSELTFNYNLECAGIEKKRCMCGARRCSGYIGAKPKQDDTQSKKNKIPVKRTYKKRKNVEDSPSTNKNKPKRPVGRPAKPRELTEIEKDLLIIKNATNGLSSDSEASGRLSSIDSENTRALKRKRVSFSTEESVLYNGCSPSSKKAKLEEKSKEAGD